jgi:hypothetical protein
MVNSRLNCGALASLILAAGLAGRDRSSPASVAASARARLEQSDCNPEIIRFRFIAALLKSGDKSTAKAERRTLAVLAKSPWHAKTYNNYQRKNYEIPIVH